MSTETEKKKGRSFSLTDGELDRIEKRTAAQGFPDRNAYLLALLEADEALDLAPQIDQSRNRVLRLSTGTELLTGLCAHTLPDEVDAFRVAIDFIGIPERRLFSELIRLVIDYASDDGEFSRDFDPYIASTQAPHIAKACARARARDTLGDYSHPAKNRAHFCDLLRLIADHAGLDTPKPTKDLGPVLSYAEYLMKAARDLPCLPLTYAQSDTPLRLAAEDRTAATSDDIDAARAEAQRRKAKPKAPRK